MVANPPKDNQRLVPYLAYADAPGALEFLTRAFGFEEKFRFPMPDGRIGHAELTFGGEVVLMLASVYSEMGFASPADLPAVPSQIFCYVDDVVAPRARPGRRRHDRRRAQGRAPRRPHVPGGRSRGPPLDVRHPREGRGPLHAEARMRGGFPPAPGSR